MHVSSLAAKVPDSLFSRLRQDWRRVCEGRLPLCPSEPYSRSALQEGREERGDGASLPGGCGAGRSKTVLEERSIIAEIEGTFASGSADKHADILRRVTDLFLAGADNYSD